VKKAAEREDTKVVVVVEEQAEEEITLHVLEREEGIINHLIYVIEIM
jgi:hypothetical protein